MLKSARIALFVELIRGGGRGTKNIEVAWGIGAKLYRFPNQIAVSNDLLACCSIGLEDIDDSS